MIDERESVVGTSPPPRKQDVLFQGGEYWEADFCACIKHWHDVERAYSNGFRRAARHLAEQACNSGRDQDHLVYPIVYLYRHHVELLLKAIIEVAVALLGRQLSEHELKAIGRHDLVELWNTAKPLLNPVCDLARNRPFPTENIDGIESYIQQIHEHDPDGQRFRYATSKIKNAGPRRLPLARAPSLSPELKVINIRVFAVFMERLADYLDCVESWFGHLLD
ncbi:MAG: hypothetical protein JOZ58_09945, partial [Acetobacteraceae bacterium]|nr:hypothetical protein [Acetobacteraceae bacterium]